MVKKYMSQDIYDAGVSTIGYLHNKNLMSISEAIIKLRNDHYEPYIIDDGVWEEMSNTVEDYLSYIDESNTQFIDDYSLPSVCLTD